MKTSIVFLWLALSLVSIVLILSRETNRDPQSENKYSVLETTVQDRHMTIKMRRATKEEIQENQRRLQDERTQQK